VEELDLGSIFSVELDDAKRAAIESEIASLDGQVMLLKQQRDNIFALSAAKDMNIAYVSGKLRDCEAQITQTEAKIEGFRDQLGSMSAAVASYYESRDQIKELISRVKTKSADDYKTRAQIASRLKSLITRIDVAVAGQARSNKRIANFLETACDEVGTSPELRQNAAEALDLHRSMIGGSENFRYILVWFKDGTTRIVWPSADDPLQFEQRMASSVMLAGEQIQVV
jgi:chromosome segregation ATPase